MTQYKNRSEIPVEYTWALEDLYPSDAAWEETLATLDQDIKALSSYAGKLAESAQTLNAYLLLMEEVGSKCELLANYCMRKSDQNTAESCYQAMVGKFMGVYVSLGAAISFETPEIMEISDETWYFGFNCYSRFQTKDLLTAFPSPLDLRKVINSSLFNVFLVVIMKVMTSKS